MAADADALRDAALHQPGAVERTIGIKFPCPACRAEGHDKAGDNAILFHGGKWGCAWAKDTGIGLKHWQAIGEALGAFQSNGHAPVGARQRAEGTPAGTDGLGLVGVGELLGEPAETQAWVVDGRLPAAGLGLLAGKPKAGKSTAGRCLVLSVSRGAPWLGFATIQGPVIYLALEEKRAEVRKHFRALGATDDDPIYLLCASAPDDALARLRVEVERRRPVLVVIDPLFRFVRVVDGNDYATMTAALEPLLVLARETGACVLLVHHLGKGERNDGDNVLGSTAIFGAVDSALLMKRTERYRTLSSIQRYGDDLEEIIVELDPVTRGVSAGGTREAAEQTHAEGLILTFLDGASAPKTEAEIDDGVECRTKPKRAALRALVKAGKVSRTGRGGRGNPFLFSCSLSIAGNKGTETASLDPSGEQQSEDSCSNVPHGIVVPLFPRERE